MTSAGVETAGPVSATWATAPAKPSVMRTETIAWVAAAVALAPVLPTILALALDDRTLNGAALWAKPLRFELSLSIYAATLAALSRLVDADRRQSALLRGAMIAATLFMVEEFVWLLFQAARGRASHFNLDTPLDLALYIGNGFAAAGIVFAPVVLGVAIARSRGRSALHLGATLGLILGSVMTGVLAGYLSAQGSHFVGGPHSDAFGLPFFGWATRGGDIRVAHFFATHAFQVLPVAGWLLDRSRWQEKRLAIFTIAALYVAFVLAVFVEALAGVPFLAVG